MSLDRLKNEKRAVIKKASFILRTSECTYMGTKVAFSTICGHIFASALGISFMPSPFSWGWEWACKKDKTRAQSGKQI